MLQLCSSGGRFPQGVCHNSELWSGEMLQLCSAECNYTLLQQGKVSPVKVLQLCSAPASFCSQESHYSPALLKEFSPQKCSSFTPAQVKVMTFSASPLLQRKKLVTTNLTQEIYWEGGIQESDLPLPGWKKGNPKLNRYRAYIGFLRGGAFQDGDFSGW